MIVSGGGYGRTVDGTWRELREDVFRAQRWLASSFFSFVFSSFSVFRRLDMLPKAFYGAGLDAVLIRKPLGRYACSQLCEKFMRRALVWSRG